MTQPIQEPTTQRSVSGLDWGQSQLARRPSLAASGSISWARVSTNAVSDITVLSGSNKTITTFNQTETSDSSFWTTTASSIQVTADGFYFVKGQTQWSSYGLTIPTSIRETWIVVNGDYATATETEASPLNDFVMVNGWVFLTTGDVCTLVAHQDSGIGETIYGGDDGGITNPTQDGNWLQLAYLPMPVAPIEP